MTCRHTAITDCNGDIWDVCFTEEGDLTMCPDTMQDAEVTFPYDDVRVLTKFLSEFIGDADGHK